MSEIEADRPKFLRVSPDKLLFDVDNPRFGGFTGTSANQQEAVQRYLMKDPHFASELVDSFVENGFIEYEPLIVRPHGAKWIVVEGNRRLAAIQEIRSNVETFDSKIRARLDEIPVISFPAAKTRAVSDELRVYLGVRHLFGYREWPPLSKAKFLDAEIARVGLERIAKEIGISKQEIRRFVVPLRLLGSTKVGKDVVDDFWVLGESLSRTGIQQFIDLKVDPSDLRIISFDKERFKELLSFLYGKPVGDKGKRDPETKTISETRDIKTLAAVVTNKSAVQALRVGKSLEIASDFIDTRPQKLKRLASLTERLSAMVKQVTTGIATPEAEDLKQATQSLVKASKKFINKNE
jgi:hypothetical protein